MLPCTVNTRQSSQYKRWRFSSQMWTMEDKCHEIRRCMAFSKSTKGWWALEPDNIIVRYNHANLQIIVSHRFKNDTSLSSVTLIHTMPTKLIIFPTTMYALDASKNTWKFPWCILSIRTMYSSLGALRWCGQTLRPPPGKTCTWSATYVIILSIYMSSICKTSQGWCALLFTSETI
jgi:hypothetical protein